MLRASRVGDYVSDMSGVNNILRGVNGRSDGGSYPCLRKLFSLIFRDKGAFCRTISSMQLFK